MSTTAPLLEVRDLSAYYGDLRVLSGISLEIMPGEIVAILGGNAAGKSTLLRALSGLVARTGNVSFRGRDLGTMAAHDIVELGLVHVPEGRELFPFMTVEENLDVGAYAGRARARRLQSKDKVFTLLPRLMERRRQLAHTMSGGEQQMCAIGRGMMACPEMLLLDEPSLGLAPVVIQAIYDKLLDINAGGTAVLVVEQNITAALKLARRAYVLENGKIVLQGRSEELRNDPRLKSAYVGR